MVRRALLVPPVREQLALQVRRARRAQRVISVRQVRTGHKVSQVQRVLLGRTVLAERPDPQALPERLVQAWSALQDPLGRLARPVELASPASLVPLVWVSPDPQAPLVLMVRPVLRAALVRARQFPVPPAQPEQRARMAQASRSPVRCQPTPTYRQAWAQEMQVKVTWSNLTACSTSGREPLSHPTTPARRSRDLWDHREQPARQVRLARQAYREQPVRRVALDPLVLRDRLATMAPLR